MVGLGTSDGISWFQAFIVSMMIWNHHRRLEVKGVAAKLCRFIRR